MIAAGHDPPIWQQSLCKLPIKFLPSHQFNLKLAKMLFPPSSVTLIHSVSDGMFKVKDKLLWRSSLNIILTVFFSIFRNPPEDLSPRRHVLHPGDGDQAVDLVQGQLQPGPGRHHRPPPGQLQRQVEEVWRWVLVLLENLVFLASFRLWLMDLLPCNYTIWHKNYNIKLT